MKRINWCAALLITSALALPEAASAGGAWVPAPGEGDVSIGYSRKTASSSWDRQGNGYDNTTVREGHTHRHHHDFRYTYLSGEVGLVKNVSATFLVTHLYGLEGPRHELERNSGLSDAWFGLKYSLRQGNLPMALAFTYRTPYFYDLEGPYSRHLFDSTGKFRGVSPEWRGLLKHDYTLSYLISDSFRDGRGWWNVQAGYTLREGAPADEVPISADLGYPLPFWNANLKAATVMVLAQGNDTLRKPDDRFGTSARNNFNNASMMRAGVGLIVPFGEDRRWAAEVGYNQWLWGKSARQYQEPYLSVSRRF
jgi:hypothetical protein